MGVYYNPPAAIPSIGRLLDAKCLVGQVDAAREYARLSGLLAEGEVLIGMYDSPHPYLAAALIDSEDRLAELSWGGHRADMYAVARSEAEPGFNR